MESFGRIITVDAGKWLLALLLMFFGTKQSFGHPGSGIVVDGDGRIYFTDTGQGVWQIDPQGRVTAHEGPAFHWMAIDREGRFATGRWPSFVEPSTTIDRVGRNPTLLISSDFPLTTDAAGALYYPEFATGGPLRIYKIDATGEGAQRKVFATVATGAEGGDLQWLNGMAAAPDGSIYFSENAAVRRITAQGVMSTIVRDVIVADCQRLEGMDERLGPMLRGLDIARDGTIYVAANACRALLKVTPGGVVTPILRTNPPWSPTGVAVHGDAIYVLEYLHTKSGNRREWTPRVRRISADRSNTIIAAIERSGEKDSRPVAAERLQRDSSAPRTKPAGELKDSSKH